MRFSANWIPDGENASAEERATLCELGIFIGAEDSNVSTFFDVEEKQEFESILLPAVHLAEGIASHWWEIFGGRDVEHSFLPWRTGFALPDVRLAFDGAELHVSCEQSEMANPSLSFLHGGSEYLNRTDAEFALSTFVDQVVAKLAADEVAPTEVALAWERVVESRADVDEAAFCEAAGALGCNPYAIAEADANFIVGAAEYFEGEALAEFLAGVRLAAGAVREKIIDWVSKRRPARRTCLPELTSLAQQLAAQESTSLGQRPWERGARLARECRAAMDISSTAPISIKDITQMLGGVGMARAAGPDGIYALVDHQGDDVHIHLRHRGRPAWARAAEKFAFARALGDAICFPDTERAAINDLHEADRQAVGRAFAAEFTAPLSAVMEMSAEGKDTEDIAGNFNVNPQIVANQKKTPIVYSQSPEQRRSLSRPAAATRSSTGRMASRNLKGCSLIGKCPSPGIV